MFVLPCLAVLVPGGALATFLFAAAAAAMAVLVPGAAFGQQQQISWWDWKSGKGWDWKSGKGWEKNISRNSEGTLGSGYSSVSSSSSRWADGRLKKRKRLGQQIQSIQYIQDIRYIQYIQYITLHYSTLYYITIQYITVHYITLQYNTNIQVSFDLVFKLSCGISLSPRT